jgi:DNA-binding NtrC family response regulator
VERPLEKPNLPRETEAGATYVAAAHVSVRVKEALDKAARADVRVVLYGEPGTGKAHAARHLHSRSARRDGRFERLVVRDVRALARLSDPSFSPALQNGTVLLERVDEAPPDVQAFLAAALEEWASVQEETSGAVRVIASATKDLSSLTEAGLFRRDLYYLLEVFPLALPPLRERPEEIFAFLRHFHHKYAPGRLVPPLPGEFVRVALGYPWPGNLKELENLVAASVAATGGETWELPKRLPRRGPLPDPLTFQAARREFEAGYVRRLLLLTSGNVTQAAELAGKARKDFYALLSRNGVEPAEFRR